MDITQLLTTFGNDRHAVAVSSHRTVHKCRQSVW